MGHGLHDMWHVVVSSTCNWILFNMDLAHADLRWMNDFLGGWSPQKPMRVSVFGSHLHRTALEITRIYCRSCLRWCPRAGSSATPGTLTWWPP